MRAEQVRCLPSGRMPDASLYGLVFVALTAGLAIVVLLFALVHVEHVVRVDGLPPLGWTLIEALAIVVAVEAAAVGLMSRVIEHRRKLYEAIDREKAQFFDLGQ